MTHEEPAISRLDPGVSAALMRFKRMDSLTKNPYPDTEETWVDEDSVIAFCESDGAKMNDVPVTAVDEPAELDELIEPDRTEIYRVEGDDDTEAYVQRQYMDTVMDVLDADVGEMDMYVGSPGERSAMFIRVDDPDSPAMMMVASYIHPDDR